MELYKEMPVHMLQKEKVKIRVYFPGLRIDAAGIVERQSYKALRKIKAALENDGLSDFECIEAIMDSFLHIGCAIANRHDL